MEGVRIYGKPGNSEGSIYFRSSDKRWVSSITLENGKRKVIYGKTRKEVADKLKLALHEQQQGTIGQVVIANGGTVC